MRCFICIPALLLIICCSPKTPPYSCGPTMNQKSIRNVFGPIIQYMDIQDGDTFADVGAASGGFTVMMSTLLNNNIIYVQDIDTTCLNVTEFNKVLNYYTKQSKKPLTKMHEFKVVVGSTSKTNLPIAAIDKIYTNGTLHVFSEPHSMLRDMYQTLRPSGLLFIRDSFSPENEIKMCEDKKCGRAWLKKSVFLDMMTRNGFKLEKSKEMSGSPVFVFSKVVD